MDRVTVLNVDDSRDSLRIKTVSLERAGFQVLESTTGQQALQLVVERRPQVVLLDVNLPDISGYEVCRQIKSNPETASILVVQISACFVKGSDRTRGLEGGADGYLTSPVEPPLLVATIKSLLRVQEREVAAQPLFRHWQATFDALPDGILLLDNSGNLLKCNAACAQILEGSLLQPGSDLRGVFPTDPAEPAAQRWKALLESRLRNSIEFPRGEGWLQVTADPLMDDQGAFLGTVCVIRNITGQKRLEKSLQQFQEFSRHSRDAFLVLRPDGRILDVNKAALALYGFSREEFLQKNLQELSTAGADSSQEGTTFWLKDSGGAFRQGEQRRKDGTIFPAEIFSRASFLGGAEVCLSMIRDLSHQKLVAGMGESDARLRPGEESPSRLAPQERVPGEKVPRFPLQVGAHATLVELGELASYHPSLHQIFQLLPQMAASQSTILIQGETGTGKELLARTLHNLSSRAGQPFVAVNCSAIPDTLLESELFGYRAGAFTGAVKDKPGRFALAHNGTIFLDEIGDMSPILQAKLLRVLQQKTFEPLGGTTSEKTNARILVATHRDLAAMVQAGTFRADLYYRINVLKIELPALRDRKEDIPLLVDRFVSRFNRETEREIRGISRQALSALAGYDFPGNIRELENLVERAFILCTGDQLDIEHLPDPLVRSVRQELPAERIVADLKSLEAQAILESLERNRFNRLATARELGIHKSTLFRKLKELGMQLPPADGRSRKD